MNPAGCAARAREILDKAGLADRRIAVVTATICCRVSTR